MVAQEASEPGDMIQEERDVTATQPPGRSITPALQENECHCQQTHLNDASDKRP